MDKLSSIPNLFLYILYTIHIDCKLCVLLILFSRKKILYFLKTNRLSLLDSSFSLLHFAEILSLDQLPSRFALFSDYLRLSEGSGARRSPGSKRKKDISRYVDLIEFLLPWSMPTMLIRPEFPSQISIMKA